MNLFEKGYISNIILLVILIFLANYLSKGSILNVLGRYYGKTKDYLFNNVTNDEDYMNRLYIFLESILSNKPRPMIIIDGNKEYKLSKDEIEELKNYLLKRLSNHEFKFSNLNILDKLVYYKDDTNMYIKPFTFTSDVELNGKHLDNFKFNSEMSVTFNNLYYSPMKLGFPEILSLKIYKENTCTLYDHHDHVTSSDSDNMIPNTINLTETIGATGASDANEKSNTNHKEDFTISLPTETE